jgi:hypothetical protein
MGAHAMSGTLPPLPPGFVFEPASGLPPIPEGFVLEAPPQAAAAPQRGFGESVARLAGQLGAGFNERLGQVVGALPDLYNRGLRAAGLPAMPEGAYTRGIEQGLEAYPCRARGGCNRTCGGRGAILDQSHGYRNGVPACATDRSRDSGGRSR